VKRVLVVGAGMVARPLVRYLLDRGYGVTQGDLAVHRAEEMIAGHPLGRAVELDVSDPAALAALVRDHDLAVSLAPPAFHPLVARVCVENGRPMVTSSYVAPEMAALDGPARDAGVTLLNEMGADPGIDLMSAMQVIDGVRARGGRVLAFRSYCGGLPAPECNDNPLGYKLSWTARGVLQASTNDAVYRAFGRPVHTPNAHLFRDMHMVHVPGLGDFEAYPNRDSLSYVEIYGLQDAATLVRGTLRYPGWCDTLNACVNLGLLSEEPAGDDCRTYRELSLRAMGAAADRDPAAVAAERLRIAAAGGPLFNLDWLGMFADDELPARGMSPLDALASRMQERLVYAEGERDMLVLQHEFVSQMPDGRREHTWSRLVAYGERGGDSAMARTVSLPAALGARLILEGRLGRPGVLRPTTEDIYGPVLADLAALGVRCEEETEILEP